MNHGLRSVLLLIFTIGCAFGQDGKLDGKAQYELYCGACHGVDGKGATGGQFPPLADSNWVKGTPSRMLQVVLHGLQGEITVNSEGKDKSYNLVMPPQGMALTDEQIAAIATYVRASWGNKSTAVTPEMVAAERKVSAERTAMWTEKEILKDYPFPQSKNKTGKIENLIAKVYEGKFKSLEDLRKAEPVSAEEEKDGVISLRHAGKRKDHFGVIWTGELVAPKAGDYSFELDADDGAAIFVNDTLVVELDRIGPMGHLRRGRILLEKGRHNLRVEYFEAKGKEGIAVQWKGPQMKPTLLSETKSEAKELSHPNIFLVPPPGQAMIYRNFIQGTTPRGIGVGFDRGLNLAFSADNMAVELLWRGKFLDGGLHWTARGIGSTKPLGEPIRLSTGPAFAILPDEKSAWPKAYGEVLNPKFVGYELKDKKHPMFFYRLGNLQVSDFPEPKGGEKIPGLARKIRIEAGDDAPELIYFRVSSGLPVKKVGSRGFQIGDRLFVQIAGNASGNPVIRGKELLLPVSLKAGVNKIFLNYTLD